MAQRHLPMRGGALLGSGTYGCVYSPPLPCLYNPSMNQRHQKDVMKLANFVESRMEEEIAAVLREVDPRSDYFLPLSGDRCIVDPSNAEYALCDRAKGSPDDMIGYFMKHGGITLEYFITHHPDKVNIYYVWYLVVWLTSALVRLKNVGLLHLDVKTTNIMIGDDKNPRLIDFGLSEFVSHVGPNTISYTYEIHSPFMVMYNAGHDQIDEFSDSYRVFSDPIFRDDRWLENMFTKSRLHHLEYFEQIVKPNLYKIDLFSLYRTVYLHLYLPFKTQLEQQDPVLTKELVELMRGCTDVRYTEQWTLEQVTKYFVDHDILHRIGGKY